MIRWRSWKGYITYTERGVQRREAPLCVWEFESFGMAGAESEELYVRLNGWVRAGLLGH